MEERIDLSVICLEKGSEKENRRSITERALYRTVASAGGGKVLIIGVFHARQGLLIAAPKEKDFELPLRKEQNTDQWDEHTYTEVMAKFIKEGIDKYFDPKQHESIILAGDINLGYSGSCYPRFMLDGSLIEKLKLNIDVPITMYVGSSTSIVIDGAKQYIAEHLSQKQLTFVNQHIHMIEKATISPTVKRKANEQLGNISQSVNNTLLPPKRQGGDKDDDMNPVGTAKKM